MLITKEVNLWNFDFWSSAADTAAVFTIEQMDELEDILTDLYPDGINETKLNDLFRYDEDFLAQQLGFDDFEELAKFNRGEELDEGQEMDEDEQEQEQIRSFHR